MFLESASGLNLEQYFCVLLQDLSEQEGAFGRYTFGLSAPMVVSIAIQHRFQMDLFPARE
jgi:hypothetical protein